MTEVAETPEATLAELITQIESSEANGTANVLLNRLALAGFDRLSEDEQLEIFNLLTPRTRMAIVLKSGNTEQMDENGFVVSDMSEVDKLKVLGIKALVTFVLCISLLYFCLYPDEFIDKSMKGFDFSKTILKLLFF